MITIDTTPDNLSSVYQPISFVVKSTLSNPELKLKCQIQVYEASNWKNIATQVLDPIDGGAFVLYAQQFLQAAIQTSLPTGPDSTVVDDDQSLIEYRVRFTELIYDSNNLYTSSGNELSSSYYCTNTIIQAEDRYQVGDYLLTPSSSRILSRQEVNYPKQLEAAVGQPLVITFLYDDNDYSVDVNVNRNQ